MLWAGIDAKGGGVPGLLRGLRTIFSFCIARQKSAVLRSGVNIVSIHSVAGRPLFCTGTTSFDNSPGYSAEFVQGAADLVPASNVKKFAMPICVIRFHVVSNSFPLTNGTIHLSGWQECPGLLDQIRRDWLCVHLYYMPIAASGKPA